MGEEVAAGAYSHMKSRHQNKQLAYALVDRRLRVAVFLEAAGGGAVDLVMRPDLVLPRTVGRSTTAGACNRVSYRRNERKGESYRRSLALLGDVGLGLSSCGLLGGSGLLCGRGLCGRLLGGGLLGHGLGSGLGSGLRGSLGGSLLHDASIQV